jgi:D-alanyl-D-alanine carboxypeptidase (penicillin-binding protein 5/6)
MLWWGNFALAATPPQVDAEAAVVMVAGDKRVLFGKQPERIMYPASTTKIMTLITALEKGNPDSTVVVSSQAASCEGSSLELKAGDRLSFWESLYGLMLVSGNDAAEAIAENVAGSVPAFVQMMNEKADKIGATRTHFSNPHGLPDPINHFTTAYDLALITAYGMQNPAFSGIVSTRATTVHFLNRDSMLISNTNKLLSLYADANGVKTGYTEAAGECLVAAAKRNNIQLIAVVLNSEKRWEDAAKMLDYGFQQMGL